MQAREARAQKGGENYTPGTAPQIPATHTGGTDDVCQVCQMEFDLKDNHFGACFGHNPEKFNTGDSREQRVYKIRGNAGTLPYDVCVEDDGHKWLFGLCIGIVLVWLVGCQVGYRSKMSRQLTALTNR